MHGSPYGPDAVAVEQGTRDKLFIRGRYYSDKSPVPALAMAGVYQVLQWTTGLVARENPARFCYLLTLFTSGLAYVISVCTLDGLARALDPFSRLLVTGSFALATVALPYARQVNNHILLLAICCLLLRHFVPRTAVQLIVAGALIGLGYTIDLGLGPVLVLCVAGLVAWRSRRLRDVILLLAAAFPFFALHHYLNWRIGGTFMPANAQPAYFLWPGSPFDASNLTGSIAHQSVGHFVGYALDLLFGKRGFFGHNLALFLAAPAAIWLVRRRVAQTPEIVCLGCFCVGGWLVYALTSNNYSGLCASIRWFVPFLAPAYYVLIRLLERAPQYRKDLLVLSAFGFIMAALMWWKGPWMTHMVPGFWFLQSAALIAWLGLRHSWRKS
ncbi:MAG: hypothetical protein ACR2NX_01030 [Chthoniobacterales bacterium]